MRRLEVSIPGDDTHASYVDIFEDANFWLVGGELQVHAKEGDLVTYAEGRWSQLAVQP